MTDTLLPINKKLDDQWVWRINKDFPEGYVQVRPTLNGILDEKLFWEVIEHLDWERWYDIDRVMQHAVDHLSRYSIRHMLGFEGMLLLYLKQMEHFHHNIRIKYQELDDLIGEVEFTYACCWVIGQGKEFFTDTLHSPTWGRWMHERTFPDLLWLADMAFQLKTGNREEDLRYYR